MENNGLSLQQIIDFRKEKLNKLKSLNILPYPSDSRRDGKINQIIDNFDEYNGKDLFVVGRIKSIRSYGKLMFIDLKDESDKIQIILMQNNPLSGIANEKSLTFEQVSEFLDTGDFIEVYGTVSLSKTNEKSILGKSVRLLSKSLRPLPEELTDIEQRHRMRYVDMNVNTSVKEKLEIRYRATQIIREVLLEEGFIEVETPTLQPLYGGASAKPFTTHHNALDTDFYLRISNELYLKRMIVAGFEKVFEFARDFRNEGIDRSHNPEFTMLEFYAAYWNYDDLMKFSEKMISKVLMEIKGSMKINYQGTELDFTAPYKRISFRDIIFEKTGLDLNIATIDEIKNKIIELKLDIDIEQDIPKKDLLDEFYKEAVRKHTTQPFFLIDYPYEMIPLAKRKDNDPSKIASVQLVCMGFELFKAYNELNDPIDQYERLAEDQSNLENGLTDEGMNVDHDFIRALEYGMPPTAGWGMGIDRLAAFLTDEQNIKDTIAFPTLVPEKENDNSNNLKVAHIILNSNLQLEEWQKMNTVANLMGSLTNRLKKESVFTQNHISTSDGEKFYLNPKFATIIKSSGESDINKLRDSFKKDSDTFVAEFIQEMIETTSDKKIIQTVSSKKYEEIKILGLIIYGDKEKIEDLTKGLEYYK